MWIGRLPMIGGAPGDAPKDVPGINHHQRTTRIMNPVTFSRLITTLSLSVLSTAGRADHGRDFLLVQTARLGDAGSIIGIARQDYSREEGGDAFAFEPLLSWTARDWLSLELNGDGEKEEGEAFNYEATAPGVRLRFTPKSDALALGLAARYELAAEDEGSDALKLSSLNSWQVGGWLLGANVNYEKPEDERREWGYAAGIKRELRHHLGVGLEVAGSFEEEKSGEVVAGVFSELTHDLQINAGVGTGFNNEVDLTVKTALIWRFR